MNSLYEKIEMATVAILRSLLLVAGLASANTSSNISTTLNSNFGTPAYMNDSDSQNYPGSTPSFTPSYLINYVPGYYSNSTSANSGAHIGRIKLFSASNAVATDPGPPSYVTAVATGSGYASWNDSFTIDGGALNGQTGQLTADFLVSGGLSAGYDSSVNFSAMVDVQYRASLRLLNSGTGSDVTERGGQRHTVSFQGDVWGQSFGFPIRAPGVWPITIIFKFGTPIQVESWADMSTQATAFSMDTPSGSFPPYPVSSISATADFPSIGWYGITSITDNLGNPVTNYTITSVSGFDYGSPAPAQQCVVDFQDFADLAIKWLQAGCDQTNDWCTGADLDLSHAVDVNDVSKLALYWLQNCPPDWPWQ